LRVALLDRKRAKAAQFHAVACGKGIGDLVKDGVHDLFDIALVEVRIVVRDLLDQFGTDHVVGFPQLEPSAGQNCLFPATIGRERAWRNRTHVPCTARF
jgi:hypothetical protein